MIGFNPTLGQKAAASSNSVTVASDQASIPVKKTADVFIFSTANSTSAQLAASATFTGAVESVVDQKAYSILFFSDQNATINIFQYSDAAGAKLAQQLTYTYTANQPFARSGVLNGNYVKVTAQNTGGSTTTTLRLDTAYGDIGPATQLNNAPVALNEVGGTALALGQAAMASSIPVAIASNQSALPASQSGTWTVQPGNTANTTPSFTITSVQVNYVL